MAPGDVCHGPRSSLAGLGPVALEYRSCHWPGGSAGSPQCARPMGCWFFPVPRPPYVCAVSFAAWLLFTGVPARFAVLRLRCPGPLGSCSPVCSLGVLCCVCGVLGHLVPVHRCARRVCRVACAVSRATCLLFTGAPAQCVALRVRCSGPLGSCSPVCPLGVLSCVCGVLGHLAPVHRCARAGCCGVSAVSWATWLLFTGVSARCVVLRVWRLGPLWPPLTGVPARCVVLRVRCPGPLGSCSPVRSLGVLLCVRGVPGLLAPVHRCARPWCLVPLFPSVHARVRCSGPCGARAPVCALCAVRVCRWWLCPSSSPPNFCSIFFIGKRRKPGARVHCRHRHGQLVRRCNSVVSSGVCRRCCGGGRAPGVRLARPDVHGHGPGWVWLGVSLLLELAGKAAVWAVGVGCGYVVPSAGLVRSQGLAVSGCGSGLICVCPLARLSGCDGSGPWFGASGRSVARCRVRWRPSASGSLGDFRAGPGVAPRGGGLLGNGVRLWRRWPGGQVRLVVQCAGLLGCCGWRRCRCADTYGVVRGCVCAGLGFG